jgi:hypothetical protein
MRYAFGVFFGAMLPAIIFVELAILRVASYGVTDPTVLAGLWSMFLIWVGICVVILIAPVLAVFFMNKETFREVLIYEVGGLALFTPLWFAITTELSGGSFVATLLTGAKSAIPVLGEGWTIVGADVGPIILGPSLVVMVLLGVLMLRPSFIQKYSKPAEEGKPSTPKEKPAPKATKAKPTPEGESIEAEMPGVAAPVPDEKSVNELRSLLTEIGATDSMTKAIMDAGIATVTDLVSTSPEQLATLTGMDRKTAESLHLAAQKKVWFGGI